MSQVLAAAGWIAGIGGLLLVAWAISRWRAWRRDLRARQLRDEFHVVKFPGDGPPPPRWGS